MRLVERLGGLTLLHVTLEGGQAVTVQLEGSNATRIHDRIPLSVEAAACHLFGADGEALAHLVRHPLAA